MIGEVFTYPLLIKEMHLDTFGHVNNATYLAILEESRWDLITQNGYGLRKIQETGIGPIILEINLKFLKELRLREKIIIQTQMLSYEGKIGTLSQKIIRAEKVCCEATIIIGLFNLKERKLIIPTLEWLKAVGIKT
jgi:acyl-CoA thioester hydrolase